MKIQRRVAGYHDLRMDGMGDLLCRARGISVFDVGCNRGLVGFEFANNGAKLVHGCDNFEEGIITARNLFADLRAVESKFEILDLTQGETALLRAFGNQAYDIVLMLATYHKLVRVMDPKELKNLAISLGMRAKKYFAWRGTSDKPDEDRLEMAAIDEHMNFAGLCRCHTSYLSDLGLCAVWHRDT